MAERNHSIASFFMKQTSAPKREDAGGATRKDAISLDSSPTKKRKAEEETGAVKSRFFPNEVDGNKGGAVKRKAAGVDTSDECVIVEDAAPPAKVAKKDPAASPSKERPAAPAPAASPRKRPAFAGGTVDKEEARRRKAEAALVADKAAQEASREEEARRDKVKKEQSVSQAEAAAAKPAEETSGKKRWVPKTAEQLAVPNAHLKEERLAASAGAANCLEGKTFVITGVLDCLERDEAADLIKSYAGRVTGSVSKKTSFVVAGTDPGESKIKKAREVGCKIVSEEELLALIKTSAPGGAAPAPAAAKPAAAKASPGKAKAPVMAKVEPQAAKKSGYLADPTPVPGAAQKQLAAPAGSAGLQSGGVPPPGSKNTNDVKELWVDIYKPSKMEHMVGNGDKVKALRTWLEAWGKDGGDEKPKGKGGGGWGANKPKDDGKDKKAALLTGPPGVGKSTAARLVIHAAGYDMVELNASDVRNKGALQQKVESLTTNQSLAGFFGSAAQAGRATLRKTCLVMDEVDGMSGGDRGGVQELISLIKATRVPIICIANDYYDRKISSLKNHCFDLKFGKPHKGLVVKRLATIAREQGFDVQNEAALEKLFEASNADIRHTINALQTWRLKTSKLEYGSVQAEVAGGGKNQSVMQASVFDVFAEWFLNSSLHKGASLNDRMDMFFFDSDLMPLFVQENYLKTRVTLTAEEAQGDQDLAQLQRFAAAAASISHGDVINNQIRARQRWSLLPSFGVAATVAAGFPVRGVPPGWQTNEPWRRVAFPRALGHMSTTNKKQRLLTDIARCMKMHISANKTEVNCEYLPVLRARLTAPLLERGADGVDEVVALMDEYQLSKEELDSITAELRLADPAAAPDTYAAVDSKVKAALTRKYNKESHGVSFVTANSALKLVKKAKGGRGGEDMLKDLEKESKKELKSLEAAAGEGGGKRNIGRSGDDVEKEGDELEEEDEEEDDERPAAKAKPAAAAAGKAAGKGGSSSKAKK